MAALLEHFNLKPIGKLFSEKALVLLSIRDTAAHRGTVAPRKLFVFMLMLVLHASISGNEE